MGLLRDDWVSSNFWMGLSTILYLTVTYQKNWCGTLWNWNGKSSLGYFDIYSPLTEVPWESISYERKVRCGPNLNILIITSTLCTCLTNTSYCRRIAHNGRKHIKEKHLMLELISIDNTFTTYLHWDTVPSPAGVSWPLDHQRNEQIRCLDQRVIRKLGLCPHCLSDSAICFTTLSAVCLADIFEVLGSWESINHEINDVKVDLVCYYYQNMSAYDVDQSIAPIRCLV